MYINGAKITCNKRSRERGSTPLQRAMATCAELEAAGIRPTYKALRSCHFGSVTAKQALDQYLEQQKQRRDMPPPPPVLKRENATGWTAMDV
jgi:hypothetical protein